VKNLGTSSAECSDEDILRYLEEQRISEVCNIWETFRAGTRSTAEINEFSDYLGIDAHAMTCDVLSAH
jgi:hypothetical protein